MKVIDILSLCSDVDYLNIISSKTMKVLSSYSSISGDSIDSRLNDFEVAFITTECGSLNLYIK